MPRSSANATVCPKSVDHYRHAAAIIVKGRHVAVPYAPNTPSEHAEMRALRLYDKLIASGQQRAGKPITLVVVRTSAVGNWAMSKPCAACERVIKQRADIKTVVYSTGDGELAAARRTVL